MKHWGGILGPSGGLDTHSSWLWPSHSLPWVSVYSSVKSVPKVTFMLKFWFYQKWDGGWESPLRRMESHRNEKVMSVNNGMLRCWRSKGRKGDYLNAASLVWGSLLEKVSLNVGSSEGQSKYVQSVPWCGTHVQRGRGKRQASGWGRHIRSARVGLGSETTVARIWASFHTSVSFSSVLGGRSTEFTHSLHRGA